MCGTVKGLKAQDHEQRMVFPPLRYLGHQGEAAPVKAQAGGHLWLNQPFDNPKWFVPVFCGLNRFSKIVPPLLKFIFFWRLYFANLYVAAKRQPNKHTNAIVFNMCT